MMSMHCGPVRHTMTIGTGPVLRTLNLIVHETDHETAEEGQHIQTTFRGLVEDSQRTAAICDDIAGARESGRHCLVLTRWTEHLDSITELLAAKGIEALVLQGQMGKKARAAVINNWLHVLTVSSAWCSPLLPACSERDSIARPSTLSSWPFRSSSKAASCNASDVSCDLRIRRLEWKCTTTSTFASLSSPACTPNVAAPYASLGFDLPKSR